MSQVTISREVPLFTGDVHRHDDLDVAMRDSGLEGHAYLGHHRDSRTTAGRVAVAATNDRFDLAPDTPSRAVVGSTFPPS